MSGGGASEQPSDRAAGDEEGTSARDALRSPSEMLVTRSKVGAIGEKERPLSCSARPTGEPEPEGEREPAMGVRVAERSESSRAL